MQTNGSPPLRRGKRSKAPLTSECTQRKADSASIIPPPHSFVQRRKSKLTERHGRDAPSGGVQALVPSLVGVAILGCALMAQRGFRGRATVAGIDLGTTNSVICVQAQAKGVGTITCIPDPITGSPIIPSVVSFLDPTERSQQMQQQQQQPATKAKRHHQTKKNLNAASLMLDPDPSSVVVGQQAKHRIDSHPHHTLYSAKRVLGRAFQDPVVQQLRHEVDFQIEPALLPSGENSRSIGDRTDNAHAFDGAGSVRFRVPDTSRPIPPHQVGSYVVHYLAQITSKFLGHDNIKAAVICVPAQFTAEQRRHTVLAFQNAGIQPVRILEEPTAAALAYGLQEKEGVDYVLVYDFGGGTLDVSLLRVSSGFVDVIGSDGDDVLGGSDFDAAIAHYWMDHPVRGVEGYDEVPSGQAVVNRTFQSLHHLQSLVGPDVDLEDRLAASCPEQLSATPLCTVSSFHSLAEQAKIRLSSHSSIATDRLDAPASAEAICLAPPPPAAAPSMPASIDEFCTTLAPVRLGISAGDFASVIQPLLNRSLSPVKRLLKDVGLDPLEVPEVVMVGGTTRLRILVELVASYFPRSTINTSIDPDLTVAYGAASVID
jgi:molecular chaperone DnaK (HSP70)